MTFSEAEQILKTLPLNGEQSEALDFLLSIAAIKNEKDCYGIENVNFSICKNTDANWKRYQQQRISQGFDETECWNLDSTICQFIYPRLIYFRENHCGCPQELTDQEWNDILDKMILFCEKYPEDDDYDQEGMQLMWKYFNDLWW